MNILYLCVPEPSETSHGIEIFSFRPFYSVCLPDPDCVVIGAPTTPNLAAAQDALLAIFHILGAFLSWSWLQRCCHGA